MTTACGQRCHDRDKFVYQFSMWRVKRASMLKLMGLCFLLVYLVGSPAWSRPPNETDLLAGTLTAEEVGRFIEQLAKKPASIAIFEVKVNAPLESNFGEALEAEINRVIRESGVITMMTCFECRAPRLEVRDDKLVVRKGSPDQGSLAQLGKQLGVDSFLVIEVYRTRFSLVSSVTLFQAVDGVILGTKQIRIPALDWSDAGLQIVVGVGPSFVSGGIDPPPDNQSFSTSAHIGVLEEIGMGKAGLVFGAETGPRGGFGYVLPTVAWRGRFGSYGIYSLKELGVGFGTSENVGGVAVRGAYTIMLGSFTMVGADVVGLIPLATAVGRKPVSTAATLYIGFSFGR